ncbi:MAG: TatD family hydrolase [Patescibacteria group bacterium]|nr:TatD family hydrolase [Patescibacteria group bacterium]MDD4304500.1 TatD family hydrolase [Patescibacteria group bacterium]MDD4694860.1 TatD family hydrolase [Patescibacteria group bacterium]
MIIDSHLHISTTNKSKTFAIAKKELLLEMKKNKVNQVIVIPDNVKNPYCADLDIVSKLIKNDYRFFMIATLKIDSVNKKNIAKIETLFKNKKAIGFKIFPGHDPIYPTDTRWFPIYKLCEKYNIPLIIHTGINSNNKSVAKFNDPKYIIKVANKFKNLKIIIAHYFWPKLDYCFEKTNGFDNIYFDLSALADEEVVKKSGGIKKIRQILLKTHKRKPDSLLFGTDWPMCNVTKHIDLVRSLPISSKEKQNIFFKNTKKIFNLK